MGDALNNREIETEELSEEVESEETEVTESREDRITRLKKEMSDLRAEGLSDAELKQIAGDIEKAGTSTETPEEAREEAEEIAEELESKHEVTLSDSEIDRLAKRIVDLQKQGGTSTRTKAPVKRTREAEQEPAKKHFTERRLWGGNR